MHVTLESYHKNQPAEKNTSLHNAARVRETSQAGGYLLDLSGIGMDNAAYGEQGKTIEDIMQEAAQTKDNLAQQKNYMAIISNSVSKEDLAKIQEEGFHPGSEDIETVVTIVDKIKASLAEAGVDIVGFTDDLDLETLAGAVGNEGLAQALLGAFAKKDIPATKENAAAAALACEKAGEIKEISDGAVKYLVQNQLPPTVENVYKAQFSDTTNGDKQGRGYYADDARGYYAKKAENFQWEQLRPQIEKIIEAAGLPVDSSSLADAKWLVEKGVPLTPQTLCAAADLKSIPFPRSMEWLTESVTAAIADGKSAKDALLTDNRSLDEKAADIKNAFADITENDVDTAVLEGRKLTVRTLISIAARKKADKETPKMPKTPENISARRQFEEARLRMTVQANKQLLRKGFQLETMELKDLVEALKAAETQANTVLTGSPDAKAAQLRAEIYDNTLQVLKDMPFMPAAVAGRELLLDKSGTLAKIHAEGTQLKNAYESAGESYETLMTVPRKDLGDSIKKAFANVDDILKDLQIEPNGETRRAVRILGYNAMQITKEMIEAVSQADKELTGVIRKLSPAKVLSLIKDGKNPLEMTIKELDAYLSKDGNAPGQEAEDYRKFLIKLEKNADITEAEKESYIGIYRLIRQIEKTDGAALGSLMQQNAEISFKNLLSAVRTRRLKGINTVIDDAFGGLEELQNKGASISEQIAAAYKMLAQAETAAQEADVKDALAKEALWHFQEAGKVSDAAVEQLLDGRQPVTADNLLAADYLMRHRGKTFWKIARYAQENDAAADTVEGYVPESVSALQEAVNSLHESFTDKESALRAYENLQEAATGVLDAAKEAVVLSKDMTPIIMLHKQISLAAKLAGEESYEVPVYINGEMTSIHLKVVRNTGENKVNISMETQEFGKAAAELTLLGGKVSGYIAGNSQESMAAMEKIKEKLETGLPGLGYDTGELYVVHSRELNLQAIHKPGKNAGKTDTESEQKQNPVAPGQLYGIAKLLIASIKGLGEE